MDAMSFNTVPNDVLLEIFMQLDPNDIKSLIKTNRRLYDFYKAYEPIVWGNYIRRDFGQNVTEASPALYKDAFTQLSQLIRSVEPASRDLQYDALPRFVNIPPTLLRSINHKHWAQIIRTVITIRPEMLRRIVDVIPERFYKVLPEFDSEYTYVALSYLSLLNTDEMLRALPIIYALFINPTPHNPVGLFNQEYGAFTKKTINVDLARWQDIVPLTY